MDNTMENKTNLTNVPNGEHLIDYLQKEMMKQTELYVDQIEKEIERRAEEKYRVMLDQSNNMRLNDLAPGLRRITVTYDPNGDADSLDYVKIEVTPEDDTQGANDNIALLLAAAKRLANTCASVDEEVYGTDLLDLTNDYMFGLTIKKMIGGMFNGGH